MIRLYSSFLLPALLALSCSSPKADSPATVNIDSLPMEHITSGDTRLLMEKAVNMANDPTIDSAGYSDVIAILDKIIATDPAFPNVYLMKSSCQEFSGNPSYVETARIAERKEVERDLLVAVVGKSLDDKNDTASARAYYEHVVVKSTKSLDSLRADDPYRQRWTSNGMVALICLGKMQEAQRFAEEDMRPSDDLLERRLLKRLQAASKSGLYKTITDGAWPEE